MCAHERYIMRETEKTNRQTNSDTFIQTNRLYVCARPIRVFCMVYRILDLLNDETENDLND